MHRVALQLIAFTKIAQQLQPGDIGLAKGRPIAGLHRADDALLNKDLQARLGQIIDQCDHFGLGTVARHIYAPLRGS